MTLYRSDWKPSGDGLYWVFPIDGVPGKDEFPASIYGDSVLFFGEDEQWKSIADVSCRYQLGPRIDPPREDLLHPDGGWNESSCNSEPDPSSVIQRLRCVLAKERGTDGNRTTPVPIWMLRRLADYIEEGRIPIPAPQPDIEVEGEVEA